MVRSEAEWPLTTKYLHFFLISLFLVPLADTISAEPSPESLQLGVCVCAGRLGILEMYIHIFYRKYP